ncbi:Calpain-13 [Durusdinium trenchii]|uniref:Calpain-13 n=1 Tax=Durusdinium trenchii TaxID=1381693 RepID=A0ABP0K8S6_9DINO
MCHVGQGKKCRKHLSPFTKQIRVEDEAEETEEEADPDLSFHQVFRAARRFVLGDFDGSEFSLEKTLEKAAQMERQQRRSAGFKYIVIPENPEFNESFQRSACKRLSSEAVLFKKRPQASGEAHNCGFMAALAAIADHQDGYLVRLLLEEEDDLKLVDLTDALVILTGQSTFRIELARLNSAARKKLFKDLCEYKQRGLLVTAGILQNEAQVLPNGLVTRHAYTLLDFIPLLDHTKRHR